MNRITKLLGAAGAVALSASFAWSANAASVSSNLFLNELNQLSDNSAESQNVDVNGNGLLDVGDTLRGVISIETVEDLTGGGGNNSLGGSSPNNELTGIFEVEVVTKNSVGGGEYDFTFGPHDDFISDNGFSTGTMIAMYEDSANDFDRTLTTIGDVENSATGGALVLEAGFAGDGDELWAATAPDDVSSIGNVAAGSSAGSFNVQLSFISNSLFFEWDQVAAGVALDDGMIDINGSGGLVGTNGFNTPYDAYNNVDLVVNVVPEPAALGLFGIGLLGLGGMAARRRKAA